MDKKMKTYTIDRNMSGTSTLMDLASESYDRVLRFKDGTKFAVLGNSIRAYW